VLMRSPERGIVGMLTNVIVEQTLRERRGNIVQSLDSKEDRSGDLGLSTTLRESTHYRFLSAHDHTLDLTMA